MPPIDPYLLARYGLQPGDPVSTLGTLIGYPPGTVIYVPSAASGQGANFQYRPNSSAAPDGATVIAASGGGNWVQT